MLEMKSSVLRAAWFVILASSVGVAVALLQMVAQQSHFNAYAKIQIGAPRADVLLRLQQEGVLCGDAYRACSFVDPWREYYILFNPQTGLVDRKFFAFKRRSMLIPVP